MGELGESGAVNGCANKAGQGQGLCRLRKGGPSVRVRDLVRSGVRLSACEILVRLGGGTCMQSPSSAERATSGGVDGDMAPNSAALYRRKQTPGPVRPARPLRCSLLACEIHSSCREPPPLPASCCITCAVRVGF